VIQISLPQFEERPSQARRRVKYIRNVDQLENIPEAERAKLKRVAEKYVFRSNDY